MKAINTGKALKLFSLIFISISLGFILSFIILETDNGKIEEKTVYARSEISNQLNDALSLQDTYRKVSADVLPVVVQIEAVEISTQQQPTMENPFRFFFGPRGDEDEEEGESPREFRNSGLGSGILVRQEGNTYYVLTNNHVAGNADEIKIVLFDNRSYDGILVGKDERKDLALVSFETREELEIARLGDSDDLYVGDFVLAIGNPFGYQSTVTSGIISALGRHSGPENNISDFIQTDAAINQGNSGGALVNLMGEVIGINTWITTPTGGSIGLGFSVPINNAKKSINDIISSGEIEYGWLGVSIGDVTQDIADNMGLDSTVGAFASQVFINSPAHKGGIQPGDVIVSLDDNDINNSNELLIMIADISPGSRVVFKLIRDNNLISKSVKIEKRLSEEKVTEISNDVWPGINLFVLNDDLRKRLGIDDDVEGIVVSQAFPKTAFQIAGIKSGDLVTEINDIPVNDLNVFFKHLNNSSKINFTFIREGVTLESPYVINKFK